MSAKPAKCVRMPNGMTPIVTKKVPVANGLAICQLETGLTVLAEPSGWLWHCVPLDDNGDLDACLESLESACEAIKALKNDN